MFVDAMSLADAGLFCGREIVRAFPHLNPLPQAGEGMIRWRSTVTPMLDRLLLPLAGEGWDEGQIAQNSTNLPISFPLQKIFPAWKAHDLWS